MGNRAFLYVVRPDDEDEADEIADANNLLPTLWHVLLADAQPAAAILDQRVFGDAGTANVAAPAGAALARYERVREWLLGHPDLERVPGLGLYLDAVQAHLADVLAPRDDGAEPVLSANLDELSWLESSTPEQFIEHTLDQFRHTWATIQPLIESGAYDGLDEILGFREWNVGVADWKAWSTVFGLALFSHPYFFGTWDEPREIPFEDYSEEDDEQSGSTYLGAGCVRFRNGDAWGVRLERENGGPGIVSPAQWEKIVRAQEDGADTPDEDLRCWVMKDRRYALMAIAGPQAGRLLTQHAFDDAWGFDVNGVAIAQQDGRMGFLRRDGEWHLPPRWNEAWQFAHGLAAVANDGRTGFIDFDGRLVFEPQFDEALDFNAAGTAAARTGDTWSLLRRDGSVLVSGCASVQFSEDFEGWVAEKNGLRGLFRPDGSTWLPIEFDCIDFTARGLSIVVSRGGRWGLCEYSGKQRLPCTYAALRAVATMEEDHEHGARFGAGLFVATDDAQREGLVDTGGRVLVPFEFASIDLFNAQHGPRNVAENKTQMRVGLRGDDGELRYGIWDIPQARLVLPCEYRHVWLFMLGQGDRYGFLVARRPEGASAKSLGKYAIRLLRADATPLFEQTFAWVSSKGDLDRAGAMQRFREAVYVAWATGNSVPASLGKAGGTLQLRKDGSWKEG